MRLAFDTNLLAYAEGVERAPADAAKRVIASRVTERIQGETLILARQTLAELHSVLVRKLRLPPSEASVRTLRWIARADVVDTDAHVFDAALDLASDHKLQIFDALILAAAAHGGCDLLLSEDMQDGFSWRGVLVTNPFGPAPDRRLAQLLAEP